LTENFGARALALGNDIFFAPGEYLPETKNGQALLAHEITHTAQQAQTGAQALQFQPKGEKAGIGAKPPAESFIKMTDTGSEDGFILFEEDDAALDSGDEKEVLHAVGAQKDPVNVHIHGYASAEGPAEYNTNLSAHRAAAVKRFLDGKLPEGSKVTLFAHGETKTFGKTERNRRVGVSLVSPLFPPGGVGFKPNLRLGLELSLGKPAPAFDPTRITPPKPPGVAPGYSLDPATLETTVPPAAPTPAKIPNHLMNLPAMHAPFALRGTSAAAQGADITGDFARYYKQYDFLGESLAARGANWTVSNAYDAYMARNQPNIFDKSNADFAAAYPGEKHTPIIPIITPQTLEYARKYGGKGAGVAGSAVSGFFQAGGDWISEHIFRVEKKKKK
jgi:outer membrane protein OmpA-like peptidoglycan-associated protein